MSSDELAIRVANLGKCYQIYDRPQDRLKQSLVPRLRRAFRQPAPNYYREFWALRAVSFQVRTGETVGIIGRNGSGKSTLLQIICGTLTPTTGAVETTGRVAALLELGAGFNPDFTGRENVYLNGTVLGLSRDEIDDRFDAIAAFADIGDFIEQPVKRYSSGMYVRLAFAVQACVEPQILIVDEALSVGDEKFQRKCFDYIERLRSNGCAILLVTHSTSTVEKFCQRAALLHKGELLGLGSAKEIVDQYHALLYSDEKAYLRFMNTQMSSVRRTSKVGGPSAPDPSVDAGTEFSGPGSDEPSGLRAVIKAWEVLDHVGNYSEVFKTGDNVTIQFDVNVLEPVPEIQAGILIRTVEGVTVFGTSTLYHDKNYLNARPRTTLRFGFDINLGLCPGIYFVTLAIAQAISRGDMTYLDRETDVIVLKVSESRTLGSGIAALKSSVSVSEVTNS
jgi:lipopolysaccharide transport system ATP-binding protein